MTSLINFVRQNGFDAWVDGDKLAIDVGGSVVLVAPNLRDVRAQVDALRNAGY